MALHHIISVSSADKTLKTLLVLDSARQHTAISGYIPRSKTKFDDRAFAVAGPSSWNRLPATIQSSDTLQNFNNQLKAHFLDGGFFFIFHSSRVRAPSNWTPCYGANKINAFYYY